MRWWLTATASLFLVFSFTVMIVVKNDVRQLTRERSELATQYAQQEQELRVLRAELAMLKNPTQLERYRKKMNLSELKPTQLNVWGQS